jgi:hypothetical protein
MAIVAIMSLNISYLTSPLQILRFPRSPLEIERASNLKLEEGNWYLYSIK